MKHKRGALLYAPILLVFMVFGLIYAWSEITARYEKFEEKIGERQIDILNTYQLGERYMFYIDQSAKYSAYQEVYDSAKSGGCGDEDKYNGYNLWTIDNSGQCSPSVETSKKNFLEFFSYKLGFYLSEYGPTEPISDISEAYDLSFDSKGIKGTAKKDITGTTKLPLKLPLPEISSRSPGEYTLKPSFRVNLENYDFSDYDELKERAQKIIDICEKADPQRVPFNCVIEPESKELLNIDTDANPPDTRNLALNTCPDGREAVERLDDYIWNSNVRSSIYGFCVESGNPLVYAYEEGDVTPGLKNISYRFALPFEDLDCTRDFPSEYPNPNDHPDYDDLVRRDPEDNAVVSTGCKESSCGRYYHCDDSEPLCYCVDDSIDYKECIGKCLPYCSTTPSYDVAIDKDEDTRCTEHPCEKYISCDYFNPAIDSPEMCVCPVPGSDLNIKCRGSDCNTLHCDRDTNPNTQCRDTPCNSVDFCNSVPLSVCGCESSSFACVGEIVDWKDIACGEEGGECDGMMKQIRSTPNGCGSETGCRIEPGCEKKPDPVPTPPPSTTLPPTPPPTTIPTCSSTGCTMCLIGSNCFSCVSTSTGCFSGETNCGCSPPPPPSCSPPPCGVGLICVASACGQSCSAGQHQCQSGPQVVCCNNP